MALEPFATVADLEGFWRPMTAAEKSRANSLLPLASNRLRLMAENLGWSLDDKVNSSEIFKSNVQYVVMEAVKRAILTPVDAPPANSIQQTAGPYSENIVYTNPSGDLWFKKTELAELGLYGRQTLNSLVTTRKELYS